MIKCFVLKLLIWKEAKYKEAENKLLPSTDGGMYLFL